MPPLRLPALCAFLLLSGFTPAKAQTAPSTIPLTLTQTNWNGGRISVTARFGNIQGPMRLDTGASTTRVMLQPWNKDWPVLGRSASTGASGRTIACDDVEAQNVVLPAAQGNDVGRAKLLVTRCAAGEGDLLGLNFFKGTRFALDFCMLEPDSGKVTVVGEVPLPDKQIRPWSAGGNKIAVSHKARDGNNEILIYAR